MGALVSLLALSASCCGPGAPARPDPPRSEALEAYLESLESERSALLGASETGAAREERRRLLELAVESDPGWIPPQRALDRLEAEELRGHSAWARRRAAALGPQATAQDRYLLGRLEGAEGTVRFERARRDAGARAWAEHALSVDAELRGDLELALELERRAAAFAASDVEALDFERRVFDLTRRVSGLDVALEELAEPLERRARRVGGAAALGARLQLIEAEASSEAVAARERAFQRGLELIATTRLTDLELARVVTALESAVEGRSRAGWEALVVRALEQGPRSPGLDGPLALVGRDPARLVRGLIGAADRLDPDRSLREQFAAGEYAAGASDWLARQPAAVLDGDGLPRDERQRAWVTAASDVDPGSANELAQLVGCLLDAGRQDLARPILPTLSEAAERGELESDEVAGLDRRLRAIEALVAELDLICASLFDSSASLALQPLDDEGRAAPRPDDTEELLAAIQRVFELHGADAGVDPELISQITDSARHRFGPFASVVVPNAVVGERDALFGVGEPGARLGGLPAVFDSLGRFGLFGSGLGRGPDGTVLRRLWSEERRGEHLGRPWSGTVVWCAGAEADGARSRLAGQVSGAALHEGYWVDVEAERRRLRRYRTLAARFLDDEALPAPLAVEPPRLPEGLAPAELRFERRRLVPPAGQADRNALALLLARRAERPDVDSDRLIGLEDLLDVVCTHEQGHLCDRERFLPLGRNLLGALGLGLGEFLAGDLGLERRLEYRAQLVALCEAAEPRLALIDLLDSAEVDTRIETVHARAYRKLLIDFLAELDAQLASHPESFGALEPNAYLVHQLHLLGPEQVRRVAIAVAADEGLTAD